MRYASAEFKNLIADNSTLLAKATIKFADGTSLELDGTDLFALSLDEATSSSSSFDIGAAIESQLNISLNNVEQKFDEYDFTGAVIKPYVGKELSDGTTEWIALGSFNVDQPDSYTGTIDLVCLDNLSKFELAADVSSIQFPISCNALVNHICTLCNVDFPQVTFDNGTYIIQSEPSVNNLTWLDVIGYICQITCNYAKCNADGDLVITWYDTSAFENEDWLDDKYLDDGTPYYESGDTADGGNFDDYSSGDTADGGTFENQLNYSVLAKYSSLTLKTDDVVITGVRVTAQNEVTDDGSQGADGETALEGSEGYILDISSNPFVLYGQAASVASQVGSRANGMHFRPFSASALCDPTLESGDSLLLVDRKGNVYRSFCNACTLVVNGSETVACNAESASRNSAKAAGATTSAYVAARKNTALQLSERDKALARLYEDMENASGLYSTTEDDGSGRTIYYLHDKKDLKSSQVVYRLDGDNLACSVDGQQTWAWSISVDGDAILKRIYAVGIDASYINTGVLSITDSTGKVIAQIGNGVESGLSVLSPYDNTTMLPLSWLAFAAPSANTDNNVAYCVKQIDISSAPIVSEIIQESTAAFEFMTTDSERVKFDMTIDFTRVINLPSVSWSGSVNAKYSVSVELVTIVQCRKKGEDDDSWKVVKNSGGTEIVTSSWEIVSGSYSSNMDSSYTSIPSYSSINSQYGANSFEKFMLYEARVLAWVSCGSSSSGLSNVTIKGGETSVISTGVKFPAIVATPII